MPKKNTNTSSKPKKRKPVYKFDMKKILKERLAEKERNPAFYEKLRNINLVVPAEIKNTNVDEGLPTLEHTIIDFSNYNIPFNDITDLKQSCLQRLHVLSIEQNEIVANIHFNILMKANWSPVLKDFENILRGWHPDFVSTTNNESLIKHEIKGYQTVDLHNFKLVLRFIDYCVLKKSCELNDNDLLTLAKFMVNMYFDPYCRLGINAIKKLFSICIETALNKAKDTANIKLFAQELYLNRPVESLLDMVTDLFLPLEGRVTETIYSYLSYTLFKSLLEKSNNNMMEFSTDINDWFVQDLVDKKYFKQKSVKVVYSVIRLLEHVVIIFDLYKNEEKLSEMYHFLYAAIKQNGLSEAQTYVNKLDQWRLRLFGLRLKSLCYAKKSLLDQSLN